MEIIDIIKESFVYPSNDLAKLAIYIAFTFVSTILVFLGILLLGMGLTQSAIYAVIGIILFIGAIVVAFILSGYLISIVKSGINHDENLPEFQWKENLITGVKYLVVNIVYFIIPAIIVLIVGGITNLFGLSADVFSKMATASMNAQANTTAVAVSNVVPQSTLASFGTAIAITGIVAVILFLIFLFIETMAESRLANTDSLGDALNIPEAFKDIGRIGWGKVIAVVFLIFIIIAVINSVISGLNYYIPGISIISIVVTPYLTFFASRATGLLYSDIA